MSPPSEPPLSPPCCPPAWDPDVQTHSPFPEAQPGSVGEKRVRWLNITSTHTTPTTAPRVHTSLWCPRPGQLQQEVEETDWCCRVSINSTCPISRSASTPEKGLQKCPSQGSATGAVVVEWTEHQHSPGLLSLLLTKQFKSLVGNKNQKTRSDPFQQKENSASLSTQLPSTLHKRMDLPYPPYLGLGLVKWWKEYRRGRDLRARVWR